VATKKRTLTKNKKTTRKRKSSVTITKAPKRKKVKIVNKQRDTKKRRNEQVVIKQGKVKPLLKKKEPSTRTIRKPTSIKKMTTKNERNANNKKESIVKFKCNVDHKMISSYTEEHNKNYFSPNGAYYKFICNHCNTSIQAKKEEGIFIPTTLKPVFLCAGCPRGCKIAICYGCMKTMQTADIRQTRRIRTK